MASSHSHLWMVCGVVGYQPLHGADPILLDIIYVTPRRAGETMLVDRVPPNPLHHRARQSLSSLAVEWEEKGQYNLVPTTPPKRCSPLSAAFSFSPTTLAKKPLRR
ncbi:hypothetical protein LZ31DRAFT_560245 [Colletotrichum somersetense]|nr:hypothetical protein LZ31DRAFT_560245 [Colletotrichum somersetense]